MRLKIKWNSPVVLTFSFICIGVFISDLLLQGHLMPLFTVYPSVQWSNPLSVMGIVTHIFGHASIEHILGNLTFILLLGPIMEEKYGSSYLVFMIFVTAIVTGLINVFFFDTALLGASGIVFMLIILVSITNVSKGEIPVTFILIGILFIGKEILAGTQTNQIAESAHIIGGICGSVFGFNATRI